MPQAASAAAKENQLYRNSCLHDPIICTEMAQETTPVLVTT